MTLNNKYNIKIKSTYANFNPELSLSYGHNGIKHANQLIALMKSEGLDAKVQIEPKTSAYLHMPDWGEPATPNIVMEDGQIIDTIINSMAATLSTLPKSIAAVGMVVVQNMINFFIPSGSGQAATSMPIMRKILSTMLGGNHSYKLKK